jgi:3-phenylpropionate/cinnamic acid dioxygenase small subunit
MSYERDRLDIIDLLGRYAHAYDSGDREALGARFAEDAEFVIQGRVGHVPSVMTGRDAIVEGLIAKRLVMQPEQRRHVATNFVVLEQTDGGARAASYLVLMATLDGPPRTLATGRYEDELVKCEDGRWRIRRRLAMPDSGVP